MVAVEKPAPPAPEGPGGPGGPGGPLAIPRPGKDSLMD